RRGSASGGDNAYRLRSGQLSRPGAGRVAAADGSGGISALAPIASVLVQRGHARIGRRLHRIHFALEPGIARLLDRAARRLDYRAGGVRFIVSLPNRTRPQARIADRQPRAADGGSSQTRKSDRGAARDRAKTGGEPRGGPGRIARAIRVSFLDVS